MGFHDAVCIRGRPLDPRGWACSLWAKCGYSKFVHGDAVSLSPGRGTDACLQLQPAWVIAYKRYGVREQFLCIRGVSPPTRRDVTWGRAFSL